MPFCRRCGDIVHGPLCKCGGAAVSGVVKVAREDKPKTPSPDRWSQTYTRSEYSKKTFNRWKSPIDSASTAAPLSFDEDGTRRVTALSTVGVYGTVLSSQARASSPLKQSCFPESNDTLITPDLVQSPVDEILANVFGSILQSSDSLSKHACAICSEAFIPDATIYPDPVHSTASPRYLCRDCFVLNGGSKGLCEACDSPILMLKTEGEHVFHSGRYWHRSCFRCRGCMKDLGDDPMVDLLGTPCCPDCFDTCLTRPLASKKEASSSATTESTSNNIGGLKGTSKRVNPAMQELTSRIRPNDTDAQASSTSRTPSSPLLAKSSPASTPSKSSQRSPAKSPRFSSPGAPSGPLTRKESRNENSSPSTSAVQPLNIRNKTAVEQGQDHPKVDTKAVDKSEQCRCRSSQHHRSRQLQDLTNDSEITGTCDACSNERDKEVQSFVFQGLTPLNLAQVPKEVDKEAGTQPWVQPRFGSLTTCPGCRQNVSPMERGVVQGPQGTRWHAKCLVCGGNSTTFGRRSDGPGCGKKLDSGAKADREGKIWCRDCLTKLPRELRPSPQVSPTKATFFSSTPTGGVFTRPPPINTQIQVTTLARQYTGGGDLSPTRLWQMSKAPKSEDEATLPPVSRHLTGNTLFLSQQLTGASPQVKRPSESPFGRLSGRDDASQHVPVTRQLTGGIHRRTQTLGSISPIKSLDALTEEGENEEKGTAAPKQEPPNTSRQVRSASPTKMVRPRPKSVLGMRSTGLMSNGEERGGRGMFLVRQMTGNGAV